MEYTHSEEFRAAGYEAMVVDGTEYGEVRQFGNFSFARIYESGHEVPYYQRKSFFRIPFLREGANGWTSCCCAGLLQPHVEPLRHRDGRGKGHCQSHFVWSGECDAYEFVCSDYVFAHSGFPVAHLPCDHAGLLVRPALVRIASLRNIRKARLCMLSRKSRIVMFRTI
jgi:hypothetical protein